MICGLNCINNPIGWIFVSSFYGLGTQRVKLIFDVFKFNTLVVVFVFKRLFTIKEIENIFSVFLSSYRNTCGSLRETRNCVETLWARVPTQFLVNFPSCFYNSVYIETRETFLIS